MTLQMTWDVVESAQEEILNDAIEAERTLCFRYYRQGEHDWQNRSVSPYEIKENLEGASYLLAWDHEREDIRSFLLDGIEAITTCPWYEYRRPT
jgi:predicted DNA-binding transcriptional regulator YafY